VSPIKVYEAIAQAIIDEKIEAVFSLVGNANLEMLASLVKLGGPPLYHGRIEGTVVGMAEGYARSSNKLALAVVTAGPALANTTDALISAVRAHTPMVLFTGHPSDRSSHQTLHQRALAEVIGAGYFEINSSNATLDTVKAAFYTARAERRPVILDVNTAVLHSDFSWTYSYEPSFEEIIATQRLQPDPAAIDAALAMIGASQRPIIIAGEGAYRSDCRDAIVALAAELGALVGTTLHVKNWFSGDAFNLGVAGLFTWHYAGEIYAQADCIIAIGASLNHYTTEGGYLFPAAKVVQLDTQPQLIMGNGKRADCYVQSDARAGLDALISGVRARGLAGTRFRTEEIRAAISLGAQDPDPATFDIEPDRVDARRLANVIDDAFPTESGIVVGTGHGWGISNMEITKWREPQLYSDAFGSIGIAFPLALGMAIANPGRPVLHIEGDGSVMMNVHAFDTLAHYGLPVFTTVLNDAQFSAEVHPLTAMGFDAEIAHLSEVDFAAVAAAFGCRSAVVRNEQEMKAAIDAFMAEPGPFVVDARISRAVVSVAFRRLHYGLEA
jgi:acetolactate synthase-1/2/3 large subunit